VSSPGAPTRGEAGFHPSLGVPVLSSAEDSPSGLWRSLGKRVGLTALAGSNPASSATFATVTRIHARQYQQPEPGALSAADGYVTGRGHQADVARTDVRDDDAREPRTARVTVLKETLQVSTRPSVVAHLNDLGLRFRWTSGAVQMSSAWRWASRPAPD
jgi:hypothetical protein